MIARAEGVKATEVSLAAVLYQLLSVRLAGQQDTKCRASRERRWRWASALVWPALMAMVGGSTTLVPRTLQGQLMTVSTTYTNQEDQDYGRCAQDCFAVGPTLSAVPYYSNGNAQSVTLLYNSDRLAPRVFILADVSLTNAGQGATDIQMQVKVNGTIAPFINGQDTLHFSPTLLNSHVGTTYRIGGEINASSYTNASYPLTIIITAVYASNTYQVVDNSHWLSINRSWNSGYPRGWTAGAFSQLYLETDGADSTLAVGEGDGSVRLYTISSCSSNTDNCDWHAKSSAVTDSLVRVGRFSAQPSDSIYVYRYFVDGSVWVYNFDPSPVGMVKYKIDRLGDTTYFGYKTGTTLLDTITDPFRTYGFFGTHTYTVLKYNSAGVLDSIVEPGPYPTNTPGAGRVTVLSDSSADSTLTSWTDPDGVSTKFLYDAAHRLTDIIDRLGDTTKYVYATDSSWKLSQMLLPAIPIDSASTGSTTTKSPTTTYQAWQPSGVPHVVTSSSSQAAPVLTSAVVATVTDAEHHTTTFTPDQWGQELITVDALADTTTVTRDAHGYPSVLHYPNGGHDQYTFTNGLMTKYQPAGGLATNYAYGTAGQLQTVTGTNIPADTMYLNSSNGRTDSLKINGKARVRYTYDSHQRPTEKSDTAAHVQTQTYDATTGNLSVTKDSVSQQGMITYFDQYGRDSVTQPGTTFGQYVADTILYDVLNRPIAVHDGVHPRPDSTYYNARFMTKQTDAKGQTWHYSPNALGWNTSIADPRGDTLKYTYTADGHIATLTNRRGARMSFRYDALGRLLVKHDPTASDSVNFAYTIASNNVKTAAWNALESDTIYSDSLGWRDSVKTYIPASGKTYVQHYKATSRFQLDSVWETGSSLNFTFAPVRLAWDGTTGLLDTILVSGHGLRYHYSVENIRDTTFWPTGILNSPVRFDTIADSHQIVGTKYWPSWIDSAFHRNYMYDQAGRVGEIDRPSGSNTAVDQFQYDGLSEVNWEMLGTASATYTCPSNAPDCHLDTGVTAADSVTYAYDSAGNLRSISDAQHNGNNFVGTYATGNEDSVWKVTGDTLKYLYDADGNRTSRTGPGGTTTYSWSADGRLLSVTAGSHVVKYGYNPFGLLMQRSFGSTVDRYYLWDRDNLRAEIDSTGTNRLNEYAHGLELDRPIARLTGSGTGAFHWYQSDLLGNIIGQLDTTAGVEQDIVYGLLGQLYSVGTTTGDTSNLRWKGLYYEGDSTQMYYARARWYDPVQRRFVSQDPLLTQQGLNVYAFGGGDQTNAADPSGKALVIFYDPCDLEGPDCSSDGGASGGAASGGGGGCSGGSGECGASGGDDPNCAGAYEEWRSWSQAYYQQCTPVNLGGTWYPAPPNSWYTPKPGSLSQCADLYATAESYREAYYFCLGTPDTSPPCPNPNPSGYSPIPQPSGCNTNAGHVKPIPKDLNLNLK